MIKATTILLVDDEEAIRDGIKNFINWEKEGLQIIGEAENGKVALEKIIQLKPDIVITDLIMPVLDGLELSKIIHQQFPAIHFLVLSSYDEFAYVSQSFRNGAVDYLLKPTLTPDNLLGILKKVAKKLEKKDEPITTQEILTQSLNQYLAGYDSQELDQVTAFLKYPYYQLLYTNCHWYQNVDHLKQVLKRAQLDELPVKVLSFNTGNTDAGLLLAQKTPHSLKQALSNHFNSLKQVEPEAFFILGQPFEEIAELGRRFAEIKAHSEEQHFFFKKQFVVTIDQLFPLNDGARFDTKKFLRALLNNDFFLGITRINDYFNEMILSSVSPTNLKQQASSIFYTLLSSLEEDHPDNQRYSQIKQAFLQQIGRVGYLEDFSRLLLETIDQLRSELALPVKTEDELLNSILRYIQDHFNEALSLTHLADEFHFSYSYLSSFLSSKLNMSFSEYLKSVRLEKAKQLLLGSELNLSEISEAVGYSDLSYFSKIFKKEFDLSPSRYRRENRL